MQWSDVDRRAKRTVPRQCVSDYGMHKDAKVNGRRAKFRRKGLRVDYADRDDRGGNQDARQVPRLSGTAGKG